MYTEIEIQLAKFGFYLPRPTLDADRNGVFSLTNLREATCVSRQTLAKRLGLSAKTIEKIENEASLLTALGAHANPVVLAYATALKCDVRFKTGSNVKPSFQPRGRSSFAELIWRPAVVEVLSRARHQPALEASLKNANASRRRLWLTSQVNALIDEARFRKSQGWSRQRPPRCLYDPTAESYFSPTT